MENMHWKKLERIEKLARGSLVGRFLNDPIKYISTVGYWRVVYPIRKKGRFAKAQTFFGTDMAVVLPSATEILLFGAKTHDSEIRLARYLMKNLNPGDTFCDVGAHFGYFTLLAAQLVGDNGHIVSFEASPSTFETLKKNTTGIKNILPLNRAASDSEGTMVFHEFPALFSEYNSLVLPNGNHAKWIRKNPPKRIEVAGQRLDRFFFENKISPKIIKIDVEGAETQVLNGATEFLKKHSPTIVMEYLTDSNQNDAHRKAVEFANSVGYQPFIINKIGETEPCTNIESSMKSRGLDSDNVVLKKRFE